MTISGAVSGSREPNPQAVSALSGFDPGDLASQLTDLRDHIKTSWDDVAKSEADAGWMGGWGIEERLSACMFIGKQTTMTVYQALDKIIAALNATQSTGEQP